MHRGEMRHTTAKQARETGMKGTRARPPVHHVVFLFVSYSFSKEAGAIPVHGLVGAIVEHV
jgi:hypothetical protein